MRHLLLTLLMIGSIGNAEPLRRQFAISLTWNVSNERVPEALARLEGQVTADPCPWRAQLLSYEANRHCTSRRNCPFRGMAHIEFTWTCFSSYTAWLGAIVASPDYEISNTETPVIGGGN